MPTYVPDLSGNGPLTTLVVGDPATKSEDNVTGGSGGGSGGTVAIDQTTPGTTNAVVATGNVASGATDTGNPVKVGGRYNVTLPTYTDGQRGDLQLGLRGSLSVQLMAADAITAITVATGNTDNVAAAGANTGYWTVNKNHIHNGTNWDRQKKANLVKRSVSSAAAGNPDFLKASAGDVHLWFGSCGAVATFLQIYNKASAPVIGTDTPILTYPIAANSLFTQQIPNFGLFCSLGIAFAFTTDAAGTTGAAASAITSFAIIGA